MLSQLLQVLFTLAAVGVGGKTTLAQPLHAAPVPQHSYLRKLRYLMAVGVFPRDVGVHEICVYHDSWCGISQDKRCNRH